MGKSITRIYRKAVRAATASISDIAEESGYATPTVEMYLYQRPPSVKAVLKLADALEVRAERLLEHARRLREAADGEGGSDSVSASQPRR